MMTRERELLQQALDALDRAISDDRAYIRECKDAAEAIRAHLAAQPTPGEPVALESVHLTRDIKGMCTVRVNGRVAIQDNGDIIDHMATLEWFAQPATVPLTDLQLSEIAVSDEFLLYCSQDEFNEIARAIERAHGIATPPKAVPLTDTETHAELWKRAVHKGLITVRSELIDPRKFHECRATTRRATSVTTLQPTASQHPRSSQNENN